MLDHHGSHRHLLSSGTEEGSGQVDAIVVPTVRHAAYLNHAAELSGKLGCPLVALCSGPWTDAASVQHRLDTTTELIAVDIPDARDLDLPGFATTRVLPPRFHRESDTAAKRNLGLVLARLLGWQRIVFLDDDVQVGSPGDLRRAAGLLSRYTAAGLSIDGFPDNSVVCHAYRDVGGEQDSFVGGGALAVDAAGVDSFFPDIYNEDWFYLLEENGLRPLAVTGSVRQDRYDPYRTPERARSEELGDVLAEGVFWLLDEGRSVRDADHEHWRTFLAKRDRFIRHVLSRLPSAQVDPPELRRMTEALRASLGRLAWITPELCVRYLDAWHADRHTWRDHLRRLDPARSAAEAIAALTLPDRPRLNAVHLLPSS